MYYLTKRLSQKTESFIKNSRPPPPALECLTMSMAAWCVNESRTQNFRGISECTTKIQAQDYERTYLAAINEVKHAKAVYFPQRD